MTSWDFCCHSPAAILNVFLTGIFIYIGYFLRYSCSDFSPLFLWLRFFLKYLWSSSFAFKDLFHLHPLFFLRRTVIIGESLLAFNAQLGLCASSSTWAEIKSYCIQVKDLFLVCLCQSLLPMIPLWITCILLLILLSLWLNIVLLRQFLRPLLHLT